MRFVEDDGEDDLGDLLGEESEESDNEDVEKVIEMEIGSAGNFYFLKYIFIGFN